MKTCMFFVFMLNASIAYSNILIDSVGNRLFHIHTTLEAVGTTNRHVPLWLRGNRGGAIPLDGLSTNVIGRITHNYDNDDSKLLDWGGTFEGRMNLGNEARLQVIEGYIKGKLSIFQLKVGRSRDIVGLVDSTLSSGAFSISGNALGIPKVELSIPEYWKVPLTNELISLKGGITHGWFGSTNLKKDTIYKATSVSSYYHQLSLYGRIGKPTWKIKIFGGVNHQVMWGNERKIYGPNFELSTGKSFFKVLTGKEYGNSRVPTSKIGNHLGSIDQALEYDAKRFLVRAYHQFYYDAGSLYYLNSISDGLWGLGFENKDLSGRAFNWKKFLFEFLYSKNQGGQLGAKWTPSGAEDYYNNFIYEQGWTYRGENLGNPLLTSVEYMNSDLPNRGKTFPNNRVMAFHFGFNGSFRSVSMKIYTSYSKNYGNYSTSPYSKRRGSEFVKNPPPYFPTTSQFSGLLELSKELKNNYHLGLSVAGDRGKVLYNSFGSIVSVSKRW